MAGSPAIAMQAETQFGHYAESDDRMRVEVAHTNLVLPFSDRAEFSFSLDRDTYSGATPAFSLPSTMADQLKFKQNDDGTPAAALSIADVVSAASAGVSAGGLTILGGLNAYKDFVDARAAAEAAFIAANPRPASPPAPPTIPGPVTLTFQGLAFSSIAGPGNVAPVAGGNCPGNAAAGCYYEGGMAVGIVADSSNPIAHLHRTGPVGDRRLAYHADSSGIHLRALDSSAFSLESLDFLAPIAGDNPDSGGNDVWEILGFDTALNPLLDLGDGTNYGARVAYQTVANGFNGTLALDPAFGNINALWIHYKGYPQSPTDGKQFSMSIDNVRLSNVTPTLAETPEQVEWSRQLEREVAIAQYRAVLDRVIPAGAPTVQRTQQQPRESRTQPVLNFRYFFDDTTVALSGGRSDEPDFESTFAGFNLSRDFNARHTTLSLGYHLTLNDVTRNEAVHGALHGHGGEGHGAVDYPELDEDSRFHTFDLGLGQVIDRLTYLQASLGYTRQRGYLSNPYKLVYVRGELTAEEYYELFQAGDDPIDWAAFTSLEVAGIELFRERRPERRDMWSVDLRVNRRLPALDATLQQDYRYFRDDWGITAHTVEWQWHQELPGGATLSPLLRYYTQSSADFFAPYFLAPRADGFYSSDYRLSRFGALSGGVRLAKEVVPGVNLQAGIEYYTHRAGLRPGTSADESFADFSSYLAHATLSLDLSRPGHGAGAHVAAHGIDVPAGVMFGHTMRRAGELMVGYRYAYVRQGGGLLADGREIDRGLAANLGCGGARCTELPTAMTMHMHMLDLSYAPTDWLTVMLMPQLMDMDMSLGPVPGANAESEHGGGHGSEGLGDTLLAGFVRVLDRRGHQAHLGLGVSAPTGETDLTLSGTPTGLVQDYGMQLGSGTWDLKPSATYLGSHDRWFWGAQLAGTVRLESLNAAGYRLGDLWETSLWSGLRLRDWLSATVRGVRTWQSDIEGEFTAPAARSASTDFPANYGGRRWDLGLGLVAHVPHGEFAGHGLSIEWLEPLSEAPRGVQLEREGALFVTWNYGFH